MFWLTSTACKYHRCVGPFAFSNRRSIKILPCSTPSIPLMLTNHNPVSSRTPSSRPLQGLGQLIPSKSVHSVSIETHCSFGAHGITKNAALHSLPHGCSTRWCSLCATLQASTAAQCSVKKSRGSASRSSDSSLTTKPSQTGALSYRRNTSSCGASAELQLFGLALSVRVVVTPEQSH